MAVRLNKRKILLLGFALFCSVSIATLLMLNAAKRKAIPGTASKAMPEEAINYAFSNDYSQGLQETTFELSSLKQNKGRLVGTFNFKSTTNASLFGFEPPANGRFIAHGPRFFIHSQPQWMELPIYYDGLATRFKFASNSPIQLELDLSRFLSSQKRKKQFTCRLRVSNQRHLLSPWTPIKTNFFYSVVGRSLTSVTEPLPNNDPKEKIESPGKAGFHKPFIKVHFAVDQKRGCRK